MRKLLKLSLIASCFYFSWLLFLIVWQYFPFKIDVSFLILKGTLSTDNAYLTPFFIHIYSSAIVLIVGFVQFSKALRVYRPALHSSLGKVYALTILFLAAPSGLILSFEANGGFGPQLSFVLQSVFWFCFTLIGVIAIRKKHLLKHEEFMLRSFALTLSAISLRLMKVMIVQLWGYPPMDTYRIVAWSWVLNILIIEVYIWRKKILFMTRDAALIK